MITSTHPAIKALILLRQTANGPVEKCCPRRPRPTSAKTWFDRVEQPVDNAADFLLVPQVFARMTPGDANDPYLNRFYQPARTKNQRGL